MNYSPCGVRRIRLLPNEWPSMMTPAECARAIREELGNWTLSQLDDSALDDVIFDTEPSYKDLDRADRESYFDSVYQELWG